MEDLGSFLPAAAAVALYVAIRVLATKDHALGRFCRAYWNFHYKLAAYIPFCGWMTRFIIADTKEEKYEKALLIKIGESTDCEGLDMVESAVERERIRLAREEKLRNELTERFGASHITINSDQTSATCVDENGNTRNVQIDWE